MMNSICKKIFVYSLSFWFLSAYISRFVSCGFSDLAFNFLYSIPFFQRSYDPDCLSIQIGTLSAAEVVVLLKKNPRYFPGCYEGMEVGDLPVKDYLVLRFMNRGHSFLGRLKCYISCFPYPIEMGLGYFYSNINKYSNIIIPYPFCEKNDYNELVGSVKLNWAFFD